MKTYFVETHINGNDYLTKVEANSLCSAEHAVLDLGIIGRHAYGVGNALAYDENTMKTDCFVSAMMTCEFISFEALREIIETRNANIKAHDAAEDALREAEKEIKDLEDKLAAAKMKRTEAHNTLMNLKF